MRPFRFRAAAALELRRRRDDAAQRTLAAAKAACWEAEECAAGAARRLSDGLARPAEPAADAEWYRNWIVGLRREVAQARVRAAARAKDVVAATDTAVAARRDLRVIEKYRDRALSAHLSAGRHAEQRALDEFGALQFAARSRVPGGTT